MVKADVRKDYYADLGLQASAEPDDIKKQFRKLALKYHPDRNPGKETEYNAKFQAIQAAHEILSDPQQRLKYDTDRLRAGYGKFYGPPKTSFPRKTQGFPYPGTPTGPAAGTKPQTPKPNFSRPNTSSYGPSAGSQRYSAHARAGQQWQKTQDDAQTRADAFRGFSGMRGANAGANAGGAWRSFDPKTGRESGSAGSTPRQQNAPFGNHGNQRPKSAYEYFKDNVKAGDQTQSANSSAKKKQGYAPGVAGGDEPMAQNTSAYTKTRTERPSSMYFDSAPPPTSKKPAAPETPSPHRDFERTSSRYTGTGGEKTFFSSTGLGRSATTRTPSGSHRASNGRANPTSPLHGEQQRHRSASPKSRRPRAYSISSDSTSSSEEAFEDIPIASEFKAGFKPKAVPKSRLRPHQNFADFHRQDDSSSGTGEDPSARSGANSRRPTPFSKQGGPRKPGGTSAFVDLTTDSDDGKGHNSDSAAFPRNSHRPPQPQQPHGSATVYDPLYFKAPRFKRLFFPYSNSPTEKMAGQQPTGFGHQSSRDTNHLHKKFSAEDWRDGLHEFDFLGARGSPLSHARAQENARPGGSASPGTGFVRNDPKSPPQNPFAQPKFSADHWAERLRDITWNTSWGGSDNEKSRQSANASPTRSPKKQARSGTKVRSGPQPASVATEAEEATETVNDHGPTGPAPEPSGSNPVEAEAMDIDDEVPPPPPTATTTQKNGSASAPRNMSHTNSKTNTHASPDASAAPKRPEIPLGTKSDSAANSQPRPFFFDFNDIRNSAPFTGTNSSGINNLGDVHATLPFESRAKQPVTTQRDIRPRDLKLPNPPKRPTAPTPILVQPGSAHHVLPRDRWNWYVSAMGTYMHEWNNFNRRMLLHFNTRQEAIETGLAPGWISAVGDSTRLRMNGNDEDSENGKAESGEGANGVENDDSLVPGGAKGGFNAYLRGIEEDVRVRKHWDVACEMHRECIIELGRLREWIRNGGKVA